MGVESQVFVICEEIAFEELNQDVGCFLVKTQISADLELIQVWLFCGIRERLQFDAALLLCILPHALKFKNLIMFMLYNVALEDCFRAHKFVTRLSFEQWLIYLSVMCSVSHGFRYNLNACVLC